MNLINKSTFILTILTFYFCSSITAQITSVGGFNFYDVNHDAFTVDASCLNVNLEAERELAYYFTALELAKNVEEMFNTPDDDSRIVGDYKIQREYYVNKELGGENLQWILIRPDDDVIRPVIVLTHGGKSGDATPERTTFLGMYDYVQRGYAVVYYQSGISKFGDQDQGIVDAGADLSCIENNGIDNDRDCFQQAVYIKMLFSVAAVQYTMAVKDNYFLDADALFISGYSGGGVGSLYLALSNEDHFDNPLFEGIGGFTALSLYPDQEYDIKASTLLAGGILHESFEDYKVGNDLVDSGDQGQRFLFIHGQDDTAVQPGVAPLQWLDPGQELKGSFMSCALDLKQEMDAKNIENKVVLNCSSGHSIFSYPCLYNDDDFGNNPLFSLGSPPECLSWALPENFSGYNFNNLCDADNNRTYFGAFLYIMMQIHDFAKLSSYYLHEDFTDVGPIRQSDSFIDEVFSNNDVSTVLPTSFPYDGNSSEPQNGHWAMSDRCLQDTCTALYFNKFGIGNSLLIFGDFIQLSGSDVNIFNDDFTLEIKFKAYDHIGVGVLFSHVTELGQGFELFINQQGVLQFRKTVNGNASIIGDQNVLDDQCHHVAVTRAGNEFTLYVDGMVQDVSKNFNISIPNSNRVRIGNTSLDLDSGNDGFNGAVQNVTLWSKALTVNEFEKINLPTETDNLEAEFLFDKGFGQDILSTNGELMGILGNNENNQNYDPRWMRDDIYCTFAERCIISVNHTDLNLSAFEISPNPSNGNFTVQIDNPNLANQELIIYDVQGRVHFSTKQLNQEMTIHLIHSGIYIVQLRNTNRFINRKLVVQAN